mgnify:CR=1 FL=1
MKKTNILLKSLAAGCLLSVVPAQASVMIDYIGGSATDGSALTSRFIPGSNTGLPPGYYIETFDGATQMPGFAAGSTAYNVPGMSSGCAINTLAPGSGVTIATSGSNPLGVQKGSTGGVAAAPAGDTTCYGFTPGPGGSTPSSITIDYTGLLSAFPPGVEINYLGFYFGSIDTYNQLDFYNANGLIRTITGQELLTANGGSTGNQQQPGSNVYVNLFFSGESFTSFKFTSFGVAAEFDNIVIGLTNRPIPAPAGLALLGLGLAGLTWRRRLLAR